MKRLLAAFFLVCTPVVRAAMERIVVTADHKGFITAETKRSFRPWGVNYGNAGRLMEDFWDKDWRTLEEDLREIRELGGNVVRVHLQFGKFMEAPEQPHSAAFRQLGRLLKSAETAGLYLDITGLACYRPADRPKWYDVLAEPDRWKSQAVFWRTVAKECATSPAVFCYDLMNEPLIPGAKAELWYSGKLFGDYDFLQFISTDTKGRPRGDIAAAWIDQLSGAIRENDPGRLITVGLLPWVTDWKHLSGFIPKEVAPHLDFVSVHVYPKTNQPAEALQALVECAVGKPIVIEETSALECSIGELEDFIRASKTTASGWIWHYDGIPISSYDALEKTGKLTLPQAMWRENLKSFVRLRAEFQ